MFKQKDMHEISAISKVYMVILVMLPILSMYKSIIPQVDLATFTIVLLLVVYLLIKRKKKLYDKNLLTKSTRKSIKLVYCFLLYTAIVTVFAFAIGLDAHNLDKNSDLKILMLFRALKFLLSAFAVFYMGKTLFNFEYGISVLKKVSLLAVIYILLQFFLFYVANIIIPPFIGSLTMQDYSHVMDFEYHANIGFFRPMSFFYEPAPFSEYCGLYLSYCCFIRRSTDKTLLIQAMFITVGILISTSGIGILMCIIIWSFCIFSKIINGDKYAYKYLMLFFIFCASVPILLSFDFIDKSIMRLFTFSGGEGAFAIRVFSGYDIFNDMHLFYKIFGSGYGNYNQGYAIAFSYILISVGIIGIIILVLLLLYVFLNSKDFFRMYIFIIFISLFVSMITHIMFTLYLPFVIFGMNGRIHLNAEKEVAKVD